MQPPPSFHFQKQQQKRVICQKSFSPTRHHPARLCSGQPVICKSTHFLYNILLFHYYWWMFAWWLRLVRPCLAVPRTSVQCSFVCLYFEWVDSLLNLDFWDHTVCHPPPISVGTCPPPIQTCFFYLWIWTPAYLDYALIFMLYYTFQDDL